MPNNYSINFTNKSGRNQMYGMFTEPPKSLPIIDKVFANVWQSQQLAQDGSWDIRITKSTYAWCGTAPTILAPGVKVSVGNAKEAQLGTLDEPGSTFYMYNNKGSPAFHVKEGHTADPGCYEIDTEEDFTPELNFLAGMAAPDGNGKMVPVASFEALPNNKINILPHVDYYISAFSTEQGTAIDWKSQSKNAAHIAFSKHQGMYGAIVTQLPTGKFDIKYTVSAAEHLYLLQRQEQKGSPLEQEVKKLSDQLASILKNLPGLSQGIAADQGTVFYGLLAYSSKADESQRDKIADSMASSMKTAGYEIIHVSSEDVLDIRFKASTVTPLKKVNEDWTKAYKLLPADLQDLCQNDGCQVISSVEPSTDITNGGTDLNDVASKAAVNGVANGVVDKRTKVR